MKKTKCYPVIYLCKEDIEQLIEDIDDDKLHRDVKNLKDSDIKDIAERVGDKLIDEIYQECLAEVIQDYLCED